MIVKPVHEPSQVESRSNDGEVCLSGVRRGHRTVTTTTVTTIHLSTRVQSSILTRLSLSIVVAVVVAAVRWSYEVRIDPIRNKNINPRIPQKRLQTQEETPRKQGDAMCMIVVDACYRPLIPVEHIGVEHIVEPVPSSYYILSQTVGEKKCQLYDCACTALRVTQPHTCTCVLASL